VDKKNDVINKELKNLYGDIVMKIVENKNIPKGIKPLNIKWIFTIKYNRIHKTILVIRGFHLIKGTDYTCIYSPVIEMNSFRPTIAVSSMYKWDLRQISSCILEY